MRIFSCIVMCYAILPAQSIQAAQSEPMAVGRENPFAKIARPTKPQTPVSLLTSIVSGEERPELFIATVKLKSLDAQTLSSVIEGMCSP